MMGVMERIPSGKLTEKIGPILEKVVTGEPVMITRYGRDLLVMSSARDYQATQDKITQLEQRIEHLGTVLQMRERT